MDVGSGEDRKFKIHTLPLTQIAYISSSQKMPNDSKQRDLRTVGSDVIY